MRRFFESVFTLQEPTYSSIYPIGQGLALARTELRARATPVRPLAGDLRPGLNRRGVRAIMMRETSDHEARNG